MKEWISYIATDAALAKPGPRTITNPFTGAPYLWTPRDHQVEVQVRGVIVGSIEASPEFTTDGELLVYCAEAHRQSMREAVAAIAVRLSAAVTWLPIDS
jgi:hypothetical protein